MGVNSFYLISEVTMFLAAQLLGIFSTLAAILCVQARSARGVLLGQILANGFSGLSYALLGSFSGAWICFLAAFHSFLVTYRRKQYSSRRKNWIILVSVVFAAAYLWGAIISYSHWSDIISTICALLFVLTIAQEDASKMRNVMFFSMSLWIVFDFSVGAYTNVITHGSTIVSLISAKLRLDQ